MTADALQAARALRGEEIAAALRTAFPGIEDITPRPTSHRGFDDDIDDDHPEDTLLVMPIGTWHGLYIGWFGSSPTAFVLCQCCERYSMLLYPRTASELATLTTAPPSVVEQCSHCEWLHPAQQVAALATTRWRRWRFKAYGRTPLSVLNEHRAR